MSLNKVHERKTPITDQTPLIAPRADANGRSVMLLGRTARLHKERHGERAIHNGYGHPDLGATSHPEGGFPLV